MFPETSKKAKSDSSPTFQRVVPFSARWNSKNRSNSSVVPLGSCIWPKIFLHASCLGAIWEMFFKESFWASWIKQWIKPSGYNLQPVQSPWKRSPLSPRPWPPAWPAASPSTPRRTPTSRETSLLTKDCRGRIPSRRNAPSGEPLPPWCSQKWLHPTCRLFPDSENPWDFKCTTNWVKIWRFNKTNDPTWCHLISLWHYDLTSLNLFQAAVQGREG